MVVNMSLEPEQVELLQTLVEATRKVSRQERYFLVIKTLGGEHLQGAGLDTVLAVPSSDIEFLAHAGLVHINKRDQYSFSFVIAPDGFQFYDEVKRRSSEPVVQLEADVRTYVDSQRFRAMYPNAHRLWSQAAESVWSAESTSSLTAVGHTLRESMQAFATELVAHHKPANVNPDPTKTLDRVSAVLKERSQNSEAVNELLDVLFGYWRAVNGIVQRQEHGAQKEGEPLRWEDGRRAVFHTVLVMTEIDRGLS
jgi:hypothetical protein